MDVGEIGRDITQLTNKEGKDDQPEKILTKTQLKKLKKRERKDLFKAQRRKIEKERQKAKKKLCRENGEKLKPSRKSLAKTFIKMKDSSCKIRVAIDCSFDDYMSEKDVKFLVKQIMFSYSANRRAQSPMQFYCCGIGNKTKERLDSLEDSKFWDVHFHSESFDSIFDKSSIVYLSSESPNILQSLENDKVYIIGGLVDHNHHKGLCHKLAEEKDLRHAQLPITKHIDMKTRKVLSITHVFEILLRYTETKDWQKAFNTVLPQRKFEVKKKTRQRSQDLLKTVPCKPADLKSETKQDDICNKSEHPNGAGDCCSETIEKPGVVDSSINVLDSSKVTSGTENGSCDNVIENISDNVSFSVEQTEDCDNVSSSVDKTKDCVGEEAT